MVRDEIRHATICRELYVHVGGGSDPIPLDQTRLQHLSDKGAPMLSRAITAAGQLACEESVALGVFSLRLQNATDAVAREVCTVILRDEATHRAFAWALLDELVRLEGHAEARAWIRPRLPVWLRTYLRADVSPSEPTIPSEDLAYGLIERRAHMAGMHDTVDSDVIPSFKERGLLEVEATRASLLIELQAMSRK